MVRNLRAGFVILTLVVVSGVALTDVLPLLDARLVLAGLAVTVLWWFILRTTDIAHPAAMAFGPPNSPQKSEIEYESADIVRSYDAATVELFCNMLGNLPKYLTRISEHIEILETPQLKVTRHQTYQIGKTAPSVCLVPLAITEKETLLDNFAVKDANNNEVPTLTYNRMRGLLAITLRIVVETAIRLNRKSHQDLGSQQASPQASNPLNRVITVVFPKKRRENRARTDQHQELVDKVVWDLIRAVCGPGPLDKQTAEENTEALASIDDLQLSPDWTATLRNFCQQYVNSHVVVAEVSRPEEQENHLELTYSHRVPLENASVNKRNQWRSKFGLKPYIIDIPLHPYAHLVEAYHQQIDAEHGEYVFDHHLERLKSRVPVDEKNLRAGHLKPYVRMYGDEGRPNAHLYIRRQGVVSTSSSTEQLGSSAAETAQSEVLKSVLELREIPPGTLGAATTIALASATIISFFAITHIGLDINIGAPDAQAEQIKATLNSDVPALLLALPAFVGVLIGSWLDLTRLRRASLTTYLALAGTMFLSLGSALYFVFDANLNPPTSLIITTVGDNKIKTDWIWIVLMAVAVTHVLFLFRKLIYESRHYAERIRERIENS